MNFQMARRAERMNPSIIREILKVTERPGIISLAGGLPSADTFPVEAMAQAGVVLAHLSGLFDLELHHCFFVGIQEAKFRAPVVPGEVLTIEIKALRLGRLSKLSGEIRAGEQLKSSATFTAVIDAKVKPAGVSTP